MKPFYYCIIVLAIFTSLATAQSIVSIDPNNSNQGQTLQVTITGQSTSFRVTQGSSTVNNVNKVWFSQGSSSINATNFSTSSATILTANFTIPTDALTGLWDVNVAQNSRGTVVLSGGFTVILYDNTAPDIPTNSQISPAGWTNQRTFTITWTNPYDESGIASVWYTIDVPPDWAQPGTHVAISQPQIDVTLPDGISTGMHTIYFFLEDGVGNRNPDNHTNIAVMFDNHIPYIADYSSIPDVTVDNSGNATPTVNIDAAVSDGINESGVNIFQVQYIQTGDTAIYRIPYPDPTSQLTQSNAIPASAFVGNNNQARGVSYRLVAIDNAGNNLTTLWRSIVVKNDPSVVITTSTPQPAASDYPSTDLVKAYRIFSVPYDLDDKRPSSFIPSSLGDHSKDGVNYYKWRMQRYTSGSSTPQDYEDFKDDANGVMPGSGFFLIVRDPQKIITIGSNKVVQADYMYDTGISLADGWNLVGTPLNMDIPFDSLAFAGGQPTDRAYFDGSGPHSGWWMPIDTNAQTPWNILKPWEGLAINVNGASTLTFRTLGLHPKIQRPNEITGKSILAKKLTIKENPSNWLLSVNAYRSDIGMRCEGNCIGMAQNAMEGRDDLDSYMPPFIGDRNIAVYFHNPGGALMRDIRPLNEEGGVWEMHVITGDANARVKLHFIDAKKLPNPAFEAYCIDLDQKMAYNLKMVSSIEITSSSSGRNFRVVVGKQAFIDGNNAGVELCPSTMTLYPNYPNPFNPETSIRYTIPSASSVYHVMLKIFNMLGQEVAVLVNADQTSGYYEVKFNAQNQSSGVYFYKINVSDGTHAFTNVKKMALIK